MTQDLVQYVPSEIAFNEGESTLVAAELRQYIDFLWRDRQRSGIEWTLSKLPAGERRAQMRERAIRLNAALRHISSTQADMDGAGASISQALLGYPNLINLNDQAKHKFVATYVTAMRDLPLFAIRKACEDWASARVPGVDYSFVPPAALLVSIANRVADPVKAELTQIKSLLMVKREHQIEAPPRTAEEQERVNQQVGQALADATERLARQQEADRIEREQRNVEADARRDAMVREAWAKLGKEPVVDRSGKMLWPRQVTGFEASTFSPEFEATMKRQNAERGRIGRAENTDLGS